MIAEETGDGSAWAVTYRGLTSTTKEDVHVIEQTAPLWLLDFLLGNRVQLRDPVKIVSLHFYSRGGSSSMLDSLLCYSRGRTPRQLDWLNFRTRTSLTSFSHRAALTCIIIAMPD